MHQSEEHARFHAAVRWIPALAWMAIIFVLSSISSPGLPSGASGPAHFVAYAILGALCVLAQENKIPLARSVLYAVLVSSAYGITDEFHQSFVPGRVPDVVDWGLDTLGSLAGGLVIMAVLCLRSRHFGSEIDRP